MRFHWFRRLLSSGRVAVLTAAAAVSACSPLYVVNGLSPSDHYEVKSGIAYGELERQTLDVYAPRAAEGPLPLVIYFYGGGWRKGDKDHFEFVASSLTKAGYVVVIADYRRFPDVVFPVFIEDSALAVAWAMENAGQYGADTGKLFLMGHSAGAHTAALLSLDPHYLGAHGIDTRDIQGMVGLSGPYDFLPITASYLPELFPADTREASQPINFVTPDAPPTLLIHGANDNLVVPENSINLAAKMTEAGVDVTLKLYAGAGHALTVVSLAPPLDFTSRTLEDTRVFLDAMSKPATPALEIVVFGATGKVGTHVVQEALARGHRVTAVSRHPEQVETQHDRLSVVRGDLLDKSSVTEIVADKDAVILSVRGVIGDSGTPESALQFIAAETLVDVLSQQEDAARLLHVGGSGSLEVEPGVLYAGKLPTIVLPKDLEVEILGQILALEFYHKVDDVSWTYVTPPKNFTNGPRTGKYRVGDQHVLDDDLGRTRVSRADFAVALIDEVENRSHVHEQISIAY
jgi:putative NADH-flavin reductase/acetyl esterase/lipase